MTENVTQILFGCLTGVILGVGIGIFASKLKFTRTLFNLKIDQAALESEKRLLMHQLQSQKDYIEEQKKQSKLEFENLAHKIFEDKSRSFSENILNPLKDKLQNFEKSVSDKYTHEAMERHSLKTEIERLMSLNQKMATEAHSLTQALRGDSKFQGDWGELVLEKILESSGLREGSEYTLQQAHMNDDGDRFRPDVIIHLPENKHVIIDSKVSLKAYDLFCQLNSRETTEENQQQKKTWTSSHLKSIENHIESLASKHYTKLKGVHSPEFVLLFVPIEPAYLLAMSHDSDLSTRAWKKGVAVVTATTLLTSLKTVASIWKLEKQNKNALEIAHEGAKLYDKFVGFLEDFEKLGGIFEQGQKQFGLAMGKLKEGPGNIFRKMEQLRELGAAPTKRIRAEHLDNG